MGSLQFEEVIATVLLFELINVQHLCSTLLKSPLPITTQSTCWGMTSHATQQAGEQSDHLAVLHTCSLVQVQS